jgi:hypothetical protein
MSTSFLLGLTPTALQTSALLLLLLLLASSIICPAAFRQLTSSEKSCLATAPPEACPTLLLLLALGCMHTAAQLHTALEKACTQSGPTVISPPCCSCNVQRSVASKLWQTRCG